MVLASAMQGSHTAVDGTLILGGGQAGAWLARLLGRRGATIVSRENFML
jgi:NADH dehydrogenase FAD-containing subunit